MQYNNKLVNNIIGAAKWSAITEIVAKLVTPITNMILARLLVPEAFGVISTITMIISFAEMFADAGFQKYIIQYEFQDEEEKYNCTTVAFWTNFIISIIVWIIIILFCDEIAILVGNPGLGEVITLACIQLPITSFSSVQMALFRRNLDFKTLFLVRVVSICIPFFVTIPLAYLGMSYWALIIGTIMGQISNGIILTIKSKWKPTFYFDIKILKNMISFSIWTLIESIFIWLSGWIDIFIIGSVLDSYHLGLYRTSITTVNLIFSIVTAAVIPILFSSLSRLQSNNIKFKDMFYKSQKLVAYLILPMGLGIFLYSDLITNIILGNQWNEASYIIGLWGITTAIKIVFSDLNSECYRAKGLPKISLFIQATHIVVLIPTCLISLKYGFKMLVYARALIRFQLILVSLLVMHFIMKISVIKMLKQVTIPIMCTALMGCLIFILKSISLNIIWEVLSIGICILAYISLVFILARDDFEYFRKFTQVRENSKNNNINKEVSV